MRLRYASMGDAVAWRETRSECWGARMHWTVEHTGKSDRFPMHLPMSFVLRGWAPGLTWRDEANSTTARSGRSVQTSLFSSQVYHHNDLLT